MERGFFNAKTADGTERAAYITAEMRNCGVSANDITEHLGKTRQSFYNNMHRGVSLTTFYTYMSTIEDIVKKKERELLEKDSNVKTVIDEGGIIPNRAHEHDAGMDLMTPEDFVIESNGGRKTIMIKVHALALEGTFGMVFPKSGLLKKFGIMAFGAIDEGYTGEIGVTLVNTGDKTVIFKKGDKIAQLIYVKIIYPGIDLVEEMPDTERGSGGFGSTGR